MIQPIPSKFHTYYNRSDHHILRSIAVTYTTRIAAAFPPFLFAAILPVIDGESTGEQSVVKRKHLLSHCSGIIKADAAAGAMIGDPSRSADLRLRQSPL
jgi:hypothetical protein